MASLALIAGETLLSLYPIIVKKTPLPIDWQIFSRLFVYSLLPILFGNLSALSSIPILSWVAISITNYIHIFASYRGFQILAPGLAMSILYLYPITNLIFLSLLHKFTITPTIMAFFIVPLVLIYSIYQDRKHTQTADKSKGVLFMLAAALTESILYVMLRYTDTGDNPWNRIFFVYIGSLVLSIGLFISGTQIEPFKMPVKDFITSNKKSIIQLLLANIFIGSIGHLLRFYSIPNLAPILFSIFSFTGIITSHFFGHIFFKETILPTTSVKLVLFTISLIYLKYLAGA